MTSKPSDHDPPGSVATPRIFNDPSLLSQNIWLIYLGFLFTPVLSPNYGGWLWVGPTLLSLPVFIYLYRRVMLAFREQLFPGPAGAPAIIAIAVLGYTLSFFNDSATTYLIYAVALAPLTTASTRQLVLLTVGVLGGYALVLWMEGFKPLMFGITAVVGIAAAVSNHVLVRSRRQHAMLRMSREEVHRLGRVAERERIGRDLHDLLGHTLSLIAIKSELAAKLIDRDNAAAAREIAEVTNVAREALKQVRTAVTGIRAAALENEVAAARTLLGTAGMALSFGREDGMLPPEVETAVAMIVREAVTNIHRHSGAKEAKIEVVTGAKGEERVVMLTVSDDGRGGITTRGNGLMGIGERVRSLGGMLEIDSPRGKGTLLRVELPLMVVRT